MHKSEDQAMIRKKDVKKPAAGKRLTEETKWRFIILKKEGQLSNRHIASRCKVSPTVSNLWAKCKETGSVAERNDRRTGRVRKTTPRQNRALVRSSERGIRLKLLLSSDGILYKREQSCPCQPSGGVLVMLILILMDG